MTRRRSSKAATRSRPRAEQPARQRIHEIAAAIGCGQECVREARLVLRSGSQTAIDALFGRFQRMQADTRWGLENPLSEILGPLRIAAIKTLHGPPGADGARYDGALFVLWFAAKPRDISLLTGLLERSQAGLIRRVCAAIDQALEGCTEPHPALIAALEQVIAHATAEQEAEYPARTLGRYRVPEAEQALERLRQRVAPRPRAAVLTALLSRSPERYLDEARRLVATLGSGSAPPAEEGRALVPYYLPMAIDDAEEALARDGEGGVSEATAPGDDADEENTRRATAGALLATIEGAVVEQQAGLLRSLGGVARNEGHRFFRVVWPLTLSGDDEVAVAAVRACALARSEQAIQKLKTRLRKAREAGDERAARVIERGLREAEAQEEGDEDGTSPIAS